MSPQAQQIAIAEVCGIPLRIRLWRYKYSAGIWSAGHGSAAAALVDAQSHAGNTIVPEPYWADTNLADYLTDLNAMHEAEKTLTAGQWEIYAGHLADACQPITSFRFLHATATQRARAFLETLGLWENGSA